jgi:hypothetical protein
MKNKMINLLFFGEKVNVAPLHFAWTLVLLVFFVMPSKAEEFRYRYVSLDQGLPPGFLFFDPVAISDSGKIYGTIYEDLTFTPYVAAYERGVFSIQNAGIAYAANEGGTVGGAVVINPDPENYLTQAALFCGGQVEAVPPLPGELISQVTDLNDQGSALVTSFDESKETDLIYKNGDSSVLDFGPNVVFPIALRINKQGIISGIANVSGSDRGFRFDKRTGKTIWLDPLPTEQNSWALDINSSGKVLGYSFNWSSTERLGIWDSTAKFKTYFVEGTPEFPTVSNRLIFNDRNLIVITWVSSPASESLKNSYLVPEPGVRLNLADLIENPPEGLNLSLIVDINSKGSMIGSDFVSGGSFLLERLDQARASGL